MKVLAANGDLVAVHQRSWPMAGVDQPRQYQPGYQSVALASLPTGEARLVTLGRIGRMNPVAFACITTVARGLSTVAIKTHELLADGQTRRVRGDLPGQVGRPTGGQQLDNLMRRPAPRKSMRAMIYRTATDVLTYGDGLWSVQKNAGVPNELWHAPWRRVNVLEGAEEPIIGFQLRGTGTPRTLLPEDTIHFCWGANPESPIGVSPLESCQFTLALYDAIQRHVVNFYANQARPSGVIKVDKMPQGRELETMREEIRRLYTSPENAGNVMITRGEWQCIAEETGVPTIVELIKISREEIAMAYGVPPPVLGLLERAIRANIRELREQFVRDLLGPWAFFFEAELYAQLLPMMPSWAYNFVAFDLDGRLRPDLQARAEAYRALLPVYSPDELRRMENLPDIDVPESKVPWMPSGTIPLGIGTPTTVGDNTIEEPEPDAPGEEPDEDEGDDDDQAS